MEDTVLALGDAYACVVACAATPCEGEPAYSLELQMGLAPVPVEEFDADLDVAFMPDDPVHLKRIIQELQFRDSFYRYFASKCGACRVPFGE